MVLPADVAQKAWLMAGPLAERRGLALDFLDPDFQYLLLRHLYQVLVRYTDLHVHYGVRLNHAIGPWRRYRAIRCGSNCRRSRTFCREPWRGSGQRHVPGSTALPAPHALHIAICRSASHSPRRARS